MHKLASVLFMLNLCSHVIMREMTHNFFCFFNLINEKAVPDCSYEGTAEDMSLQQPRIVLTGREAASGFSVSLFEG